MVSRNLLLTLLAVITVTDVLGIKKKHRLALLSSISVNGVVNSVAEVVCNLVVDNVNNRSDILPDYHIELVFKDEGAISYKAVPNAINFQISFEKSSLSNQTTDPLFESPVYIGAGYTTGCFAYGPVMRHLNIVVVAAGCTTPDFTANRVRYPNMYRTKLPGDSPIYPRLAFIQKIGHWQSFAILVHGQNTANVIVAKRMYEQTLASGLTVSRFDAVMSDDDDNPIKAMKDNDIRIIVVESTDLTGVHVFLCQAYNNGMTGAKYLFILPGGQFVEPKLLPERLSPSCTRQIAILQLQFVIFIGYIAYSLDPDRTSSLGQTHRQFDQELAGHLGNSFSATSPDYMRRDAYYDIILQALLTLDGTEKRLQKDDMTLKDFASRPLEVMDAANKSAAAIDYLGMRIGRVRYSQRLEMDGETQFVFQWNPQDGARMLYNVQLIPNMPPTDFASYQLLPVNQVIWATNNGKPPVDIPQYLRTVDNVPSSVFIGMTVVASLLLVVQSVAVSVMLFNPRLQADRGRMFQEKCLFLLGCMLLDVATICLLIRNEIVTCLLRTIIGLAGLSLLHGCLLYQISKFLGGPVRSEKRNVLHVRLRTLTSNISYRSPNTSTSTVPNRQAPLYRERNHMPLVPVALFTLVTVVILVAWLVVDPIKAVQLRSTSNVVYDSSTDVNTDRYVDVCQSKKQGNMWLLLLAAVQACPLCGSLYFAYVSRTSATRIFRRANKDSVAMVRLVALNASTLFISSVFVILILSSPIDQQTAAATAMLLDSFTSSAIVIWALVVNLKTSTTQQGIPTLQNTE